MQRIFLIVLFTLMGLLLSACQSAGGDNRLDSTLSSMGVVQGEAVRSIPDFMIRGWRSIDNRNLIITAGIHDHYLLTLSSPCINLSFAVSIRIDSTSSSITRFDSIVVNSLHRQLERCRIQEIYALNDIAEE